MAIYIVLLAYLIICGGVVYSRQEYRQKKNAAFLKWAFIAIFLLYSLRSSTVGRDLPGYARAYEMANISDFAALSFGNFEKGYLFLMWICNKLGFSFQIYLTICNIIILAPIYLFIRRYSTNAFLSTIIYVCYMYFEFNMTGIRQAIASSIVLIAIMVLDRSKRLGILKYCLIVAFGTLFHTGAFIGFFYVPFHYMKNYKSYTISLIGLAGVFLLGRGYIMSYIKSYFGKASMNAGAGLYIGLNTFFLIGLAAMFVFAAYNREIRNRNLLWKSLSITQGYSISTQRMCEKMFYLSIATLFLFGSDNAVRSYMLLNQVIFILLPNSLEYVFDKKSKGIMTGICVVFFLFFMFTNTLLSNNFDIVPYRFYWE